MDITQEELKARLHYNPETGVFTWVSPSKFSSISAGDIAGSKYDNGYITIRIDIKRYKAHRLAWLYMTGEGPRYIDHIDHNPSNNMFANLREVSLKENSKNQRLSAANRSGITGVTWAKNNKKWKAQIKIDGTLINLGFYETIFDAACTRKSAEISFGFHPNHGRA